MMDYQDAAEDVTGQVQAAAAQRASDLRYRDLFDGVPIGLYRTLPDGQITDANPVLVALLGYADRTALLAVNAADFYVDPADRLRQVQLLAEQGVVRGCETQLRRRDGSTVWVRDNVRAVLDGDGRVSWYEGSLEDISAARQAQADQAAMRVDLARRDAILATVAHAASWLLRAASPATAIGDVLAQLGRMAAAGRAYIYENCTLPDGAAGLWRRYQWTAPDVSSPSPEIGVQPQSWQALGLTRWQQILAAGQVVQGHRGDFPASERTLLARQGAYSVVVVPIFCGTEFWGFLGFDACTAEREWSAAEVDALRVAVGALGAALERHRKEAALRDSEERFRTLAETTASAIFIFSGEHFLEVNPATEAITGYTRAELLAMPFWQLARPDHRAVIHRRGLLSQASQAGLQRRYELPIVCKDGQERLLELTVGQIQYQGAPAGLATAFDVTERVAVEIAERQQRLLAEALRDTAAALAGTLSLDEVLDQVMAVGGAVVASDGGSVMLIEGDMVRVVRSRGFVERGVADPALSQCIPVASSGVLQSMYRSGAPLAVSDVRGDPAWRVLPEGEWIASYAGAPIRTKGRVIGFLNLDSATPGFFTQAHAEHLQAFADQVGLAIENARLYEDVSRHAADLVSHVEARTLELRQANEKLKELDIFKSKFVSDVAHELRTPLANFKIYLYLLERGKPDKKEQYLATLNREADLLEKLIEDLLHLSRMDLGRVPVNLEPLNLNQSVITLTQDREALVAARGLTLAVQIEPGLPLVNADSRMLTQVLTNLMTNAMNYTPSGGAITVRTLREGRSMSDAVSQQTAPGSEIQSASAHPGRIGFCVADTGAGILPDELGHIFDRFFRGEAGRRSGAPGTGLGLAICHEIIQRHSGSIEVQSQVGVGSVFSVWLPVGEGQL